MSKMNLSLFLSSSYPPNAWIRERNISIYVRKSSRYINNNNIPCLDIGSVQVDEKYQKKGIFSAFLYRFEQEATKLNRGVYVESILNPFLVNYLLTKGYDYVSGICLDCPSMFKMPK